VNRTLIDLFVSRGVLLIILTSLVTFSVLLGTVMVATNYMAGLSDVPYSTEEKPDSLSWVETIGKGEIVHVEGNKQDELTRYSQSQIIRIIREHHLGPVNGVAYQVSYTADGHLQFLKKVHNSDLYGGVSLPNKLRDPEALSGLKNILLAGLSIYIVLLCGLLVLWGAILRKKIIAPLQNIKESLFAILQGEKSIIQYRGNRELEEIIGAMNQSAEKIVRAEESKEKLIQNISHDLKTPLSSLYLTLRAMEDGILEKDEKNLSRLIQKTRTLNDLIERFFNYSTIRSGVLQGNFKAVEINPFLEQAVKRDFQNISVDFNLDKTEGIELPLDRELLTRVLNNIIGNGIRHNSRNIHFTLFSELMNNQFILSIGNNGCEIPEGIRGRLFEPSVKGDSSRSHPGSSGLGLSITREILKLHNGNIILSAAEEGQVEFKIMLPLVREISERYDLR